MQNLLVHYSGSPNEAERCGEKINTSRRSDIDGFKRGVVQFRSSILLYDCSAGGKYTRPRGGGFFIHFWRMFDHSVLSSVF